MSREIRRALISWLNYPPETSETLSGLARQMVREAKKCGAILAPYYVEMASHIEALEAENERLRGRVTNPMLVAGLVRADELGYKMQDWEVNAIILSALSQAKE